MEDPALAKGIVKREVTRVITPGTVVESNMLDEKKNNYVAGIYRLGIYYGLAYSDVSTGEFSTTEIVEGNNFSKLIDELSRFEPAELVVNMELYQDEVQIQNIKNRFNTYISVREYDEEVSKRINWIECFKFAWEQYGIENVENFLTNSNNFPLNPQV